MWQRDWFQFHYGSVKSSFRHYQFLAACTFQFHYGSVKRTWLWGKESMKTQFQFHYGSVKRLLPDVWDSVTEFQFHYGSVKRLGGKMVSRWWLNFNSTMVRLKVGLGPVKQLTVSLFQFHYGSVKSDYELWLTSINPEFQFHYGSVKRPIPWAC